MTAEAAQAAKPKARGSSLGEFYRQCRIWHGYLSAFAFLALLFFSATGILLNHPGALQVRVDEPAEQTVKLTPDEISAVRTAEEPARALADIIGRKAPLGGAYTDGELVGDDVFVRMTGVRASSDLRGNLATGEATVIVERQHPISVMNGLHRGAMAGDVWRLFIDIIGVVLIATSLIGYLLFLSLRFRLKTALGLTAASLLAMVGLFFAFVP